MKRERHRGRVGLGAALLAVLTATGASYVYNGGATAEARSTSRWELTFHDGFSGTSVDTKKWAVYNAGQRRAANTSVSNGHLVLRTARSSNGAWTAAGVSSARALKQTYGKYVIRARLEQGYGTRAVALLWPAGGGWPPEIDFYELGATDPSRSRSYLTNHYSQQNLLQQSVARADYRSWHRISVTWRPDRIVYRRDGNVVATQSGHSPSTQMWLGLQSAVGTGSAAPDASTPSTVDFLVDWVHVYRLRPRS